MKKDLRIVFMGTPDFAVESLKSLIEGGFNVVGVITAPDKPAGRGQKIKASAVKQFAVAQNLKILQPPGLKDEVFLSELKALEPDLQVVVAFRMLPQVVWALPPLGTLNLHASLLPHYRGAAPINHAIINGEKETGVTTFFIEQEIDTGKIIFQEKVPVGEDETAGSLHDRLMKTGGKLVVKTVGAIAQGDYPQISQKELLPQGEKLKAAPKIFKPDCQIDWQQDIDTIFNFIRGLSPYPAAWTRLKTSKKQETLRIFGASRKKQAHQHTPGTIVSDNKTFLHVAVNGGYIVLQKVQRQGKKRMEIQDFLPGINTEEVQIF